MSHSFVDPPLWRRGSRCVGDHHCVEVAAADDGGVLMRNSQRPDDVLRLTADQWRDFLRMVRSIPGPDG
ncbi:DUF397 domain-containing protein [Paractinoplanes abujensis]|uniref:DUF397 domain-containing protein n=1 Tax=Paractinoplanes abujensis TaxID=882441 RepID=UPI0016124ED0|nr:DUF397 domain-containing protein [Actinoplanes abujensis]